MSTCSRCQHFVQRYGEKTGECYGGLPAQFPSGQHFNSVTPPPIVKANRPQCHVFKPLPDDAPTAVKSKDPETFAHATRKPKEDEPINGVAMIGKPVEPASEELQPRPLMAEAEIKAVAAGGKVVFPIPTQPVPAATFPTVTQPAKKGKK